MLHESALFIQYWLMPCDRLAKYTSAYVHKAMRLDSLDVPNEQDLLFNPFFLHLQCQQVGRD